MATCTRLRRVQEVAQGAVRAARAKAGGGGANEAAGRARPFLECRLSSGVWSFSHLRASLCFPSFYIGSFQVFFSVSVDIDHCFLCIKMTTLFDRVLF